MSAFSSINISSTALTAQRLRMDVITKNIANEKTTRTKNGLPYRRQVVVFKEATGDNSTFSSILNRKIGSSKMDKGGVEVVGIVEDKSPFRSKYDPGNPDADEKGYVKMSNVNLVTEMVDMISAQRSYEANATSIDLAKRVFQKAIEIGK